MSLRKNIEGESRRVYNMNLTSSSILQRPRLLALRYLRRLRPFHVKIESISMLKSKKSMNNLEGQRPSIAYREKKSKIFPKTNLHRFNIDLRLRFSTFSLRPSIFSKIRSDI
jgi:hypothetical protein